MGDRKDRDERSGRYTGLYSDEDFVDAVANSEDPVVTSDVIDVVGCSQKTAHSRLTGLAEDGRLERQNISNTLVWRVIDE